MEALGRLRSALMRLLPVEAGLIATLAVGCAMAPPSPTGGEVALRATVEALRDEVSTLRTQLPTATPLIPATTSTPLASRSPGSFVPRGVESRLLDWRTVDASTESNELELRVHAL